MPKVSWKTSIRSPREVSSSLNVLFLLFLLTVSAPAATWYVNDSRTEGDSLTQIAGNDQTGDGSAAKPFRSLRRALQSAREGDTLRFDTGNYSIPSTGKTSAPEDLQPLPLTLSNLTLEGTGPEKTRFHSAGKAGLVFSAAKGIQLKDFSIEGGESSLLLEECSGFSLTRIQVKNSLTYGMLLRDSDSIRLEDCRAEGSDFRGIQLRRSTRCVLNNVTSVDNGNAGYCLENSSENRLQNCLAKNNGKSGFYLFRKSDRNVLEKCISEKNKFVGFYVYEQSSKNEFLQNYSAQNERGFTLKTSPDNLFSQNRASSNLTFGFWIKDESGRGRFEGNQTDRNGEAGFSLSSDSPPAAFKENHSADNGAPDEMEAPSVTAVLPRS